MANDRFPHVDWLVAGLIGMILAILAGIAFLSAFFLDRIERERVANGVETALEHEADRAVEVVESVTDTLDPSVAPQGRADRCME